MTEDLGKATIDLLQATKAIVERDLGLGFVTPERLRFTIEARKQVAKELAAKGMSTRQIAEVTGAGKSSIARDLTVPDGTETVPDGTPGPLEQSRKREAALREQLAIAQHRPKLIDRTYETIVLDPPWPMKKIEREVRPDQVEFDYPTMSEDELRSFRVEFQHMAQENCHVFMWTTPKFLPMAVRLFDEYDVKYVLPMVWHKPGGFQPIGLPQYNAEFILYGRRGSPKFVDTKAFNICFRAPRHEHSRKPKEFYELLARVTSGPRIDVFSREKHEGFDQYGNEIEKFGEVAE
jgi:N6-adenosine-specific RNA methylase IME4